MLKISYGDITAIALSRERTGNTVETGSNNGFLEMLNSTCIHGGEGKEI